ncbi:MAG: hypothetical protein JKX79_03055 [Labilibaculum sp.]|nr:hypothetical protein [Labilibaculum sp.]
MITILLSTFLSTNIGIEGVFVTEAVDTVKTSALGRPSIGTLLNFILVAFVGVLGMYKLKKLRLYVSAFGVIIMSIAVLGYIVSVPNFVLLF